jgi:exosortase A
MNLREPLLSQAALRRLAPGLLLIAALLLLFRDTAQAMVTIWIRSDTFAHAFLVPPIVVWLVWRRRETLAALTPRAQPWMLLPIAGICLFWLLGELSGVNAATQFSLVALLVLSVPALFGLQVAWALCFPLIFLFFAVPLGEFMVPTMMEWTANFAVVAVRLSGIPVYREGLQFIIPSGSWSVVEACSGVRYLIASFMVGTLFAYLNFQSVRRRIVFMAASLLVPILANWLRAYLIVMIGHLSGNKLAAGVDHIIYGWVFFGIVIGAMFMIGARFAEPDAAPPAPVPGAVPVAPGVPASTWWVGGAMALLLLGTQAGFARIEAASDTSTPMLSLPATLGTGWVADAQPLSDWTPAFLNASATAARSYRKATGQGDALLAVWIGYYRNQGYERKLVTSSNGLTELVPDAAWAQVASGTRRLEAAAGAVDMRTAELRGSTHPGEPAAQRLRVWQVYWIGGRFIAGDARARVQVALNRLLGRGDDSAVVLLYTPIESSTAIPAADALLEGVAREQLQTLADALAAARRSHGSAP